MKSYDKIAEELFERRKEYLSVKKKRQRILYYSITSLCVAAVILVGILFPLNNQKPFQTISSDTSSYSSNASSHEHSASIPQHNSSVTSGITHPDSSSVGSSLPNNSTPEVLLEQQSATIESNSNLHSNNNSSAPEFSSSITSPSYVSSDVPTRPSVEYKNNFSNLDELDSYLAKLDIKVNKNEEKPGVIPDIITPEPDENFWDNKHVENTGDPSSPPGDEMYPDANEPPTCFPIEPECPSDAPVKDSDDSIWQTAKEMFEDGYYNVPYLQNGNQYFQLAQILVEKTTIRYTYVFNKFIPDAQFTDCLNVQLYKDSFKRTFEEYLLCYDYLKFTYNGIAYTVFRMDESNLYDACIMWEQNGFYCRANYVGPDQYLSTIIPNLYLIQLPW